MLKNLFFAIARDQFYLLDFQQGSTLPTKGTSMYMRTFLNRSICFVLTFFLSSFVFANPVIPVQAKPQSPTFTPGTPKLDATGFILLDATSGKIIAEKNSDQRMPPASLTKLMSLYIISDAIKTGQIHLDDKVRISAKAWKMEGSRMFVKVNSEVPVNELLQGIIVASGNDATVALAEYVAGSEESFVALMNQQAKTLGMTNSHFMDSTGLPNPQHYSSAHDLAILTRAYIKNYPEDYSYYSEKWISYNNIKQPNRNRLLWRYQYADGLKTGHTQEAGYCLVASAKKDGMRLISIVLGEPSDEGRTEDSIRLLTYGFRFFETRKVYSGATSLVKTRVWQGNKAELALGLPDDLYVTVPTGQYKRLIATVDVNKPLRAPIVKGQPYGTLHVTLNNQDIASVPLVAMDKVDRGGWWRRSADAIKLGFHNLFNRSEKTAS